MVEGIVDDRAKEVFAVEQPTDEERPDLLASRRA
jgi:hypothetical protein